MRWLSWVGSIELKIAWPDERCIICLGTPQEGDHMSQRTEAHIIPESVGGKLSSPFLCNQCNSDMGSKEGQLPKDVVILGLVDRLTDVLPAAFVNSIRTHAGYFVDSEDFGAIYARLNTQGVLTPQESETIRGERNTLRHMESELRRHEADDETVKTKLGEFAEAEQGTTIEVVPGLRVVKRVPLSEFDWKRTYDEPIVSRAVPLGVAYLYLALCIGGHIYDDALEPTRVALREAMAGDKTLENTWPFTPMRTEAPPEPKHALGVVQEDDAVLVKVWFFRQYLWPVRFPGVKLRGTEPFYRLDLVTGEESCVP